MKIFQKKFLHHISVNIQTSDFFAMNFSGFKDILEFAIT